MDTPTTADRPAEPGGDEPAQPEIENVFRRRWRAKDALAYLLSLVLFLLLLLVIKAYDLDATALPRLAEAVTSLGVLGPVLYIAAFALSAVVLVPAFVMIFTAAILFPGLYDATAYALLGATSGALLAMQVGRRLGKRFAAKLLHGRLKSLDEFAGDHGFMVVLMMRIIIAVPYGFTNYAAGISKTRTSDFALATLLGMVPYVFGIVYFTKTATELDQLSDVLDPAFLAPLALFLAVASLPLFYRKYKNGREESDPEEE